MPWLSWQPALILPLLFYHAAPPSPSRPFVIAAPPSSSTPPTLSRTPPHPPLRPPPSPPSHSLMHSETRTQTGAQPVTHAPGIYARMPIIPLTRPRDSLTLSRFSLYLFLPSRFRGVFFLFLSFLNLNIYSACISGTPSISLLHLSLFMRFSICATFASPSRLRFFFALPLIVAGDDLFTGECLVGEYFLRFFESFANIHLFREFCIKFN